MLQRMNKIASDDGDYRVLGVREAGTTTHRVTHHNRADNQSAWAGRNFNIKVADSIGDSGLGGLLPSSDNAGILEENLTG